MKRFLSIILTLTMLTTLLGSMTIFAEPVAMEVIADEGWENATYDEETGILTNVDGGYSFMVNGSTLEPVADQVFTAERVVIPAGLVTSGGTLSFKNVGTNIFGTTNETIKEIVVSEGVTTLNSKAFQKTKAAVTITLPSTLTTINDYAFNESAITSINLPEGLKTIKKGAFYNCKGLTEISLPSTITTLGGGEVFRGCSNLVKFTYSPAMTDTNSGGYAFRDCTALPSITFPETLAYIRKNDFYNCKLLKEVIFTQPTAPAIDAATFNKCTGMTVTLPGNGEGYDAAWKALLPADTIIKYTKGNPKVESSTLEGLNLVGATLTANYVYIDPEERPEAGSTITWESAKDSEFTEDVKELKTEACVASTPSTLVLSDAEDGRFIRATIVARNDGEELNESKPAVLNLAEAVRVPVTKPTVSISNYKADEELAVNAEVDINADVACDNTTITKVEFYIGETLYSEVTEAPYTVKWTPAEEGTAELSAIAYNALGESTASEKISVTIVGKIPYYTLRVPTPDNWGSFGGTTVTKTENASEDGTRPAYVVTGGSGSGGFNFAILNNKTTQYDKYGNKIGETVGFIDASELVIRYKSNSSFRFSFRLEYRASKSPTKTSKGISVPATGGEWATFKMPLSDLMKEDTPEELWVYDMASTYTSNFEPVVMMKVEGLKLGEGKSLVFDYIGANWYEDDMISKLEWNEEPKKTYFQYYDTYDYTTGSLALYRGNNEEPEIIPLDHPMVKVSGFQNTTIKNKATDSKNTKITVKIFGKSLTYYIRVVEFLPETLTEIKVNEPKTEYFVGDPFDYETGLIQANYSDKDPEFAPLDDKNVTVEGFDSSTEGEKTITVTYGGKTTTYTINVTTYTVSGVTEIKVNNPRKVYTVGEEFNYHDGDITPYNGTSALTKLDLYNRYVQITGFDSSAPAEDQVITVNYSGISTTYTIDIIDEQAPTAYYSTLDMADKNRPSVWYPASGTSFVEMESFDGDNAVMRFDNRATYQCALTGGWGAGNSTTNIGTTVNGLKGVDAIAVTLKSDSETSIQFRMDYRASDKATLTSASYIIPATGGIWKTVIIPIAEFEPTATGESFDQQKGSVDWVYTNIMGGYTTDFEPVVLMYIKAGNGVDQPTFIDSIKGLWYDNLKTVASIEIAPKKSVYFDNEELDLTGTATITYDDGTVVSGPMSDYDIQYTGFNSKITEAQTQTVTATYGGKSTTFDVEIKTGGNDVVGAALSEDVKDVYLIGYDFDRSVGSIILTLANGKQNIIPLSDEDVTITGFDSSAQNTNIPVVITYGEHSFDLRVRVYKPTLQYTTPTFTNASGSTITSFDGEAIVNANIKVRNRVACETPQTAVIVAAVYTNGNKIPLIKKLTDTPIPASTEMTLTTSFTAEELENATSIKIIALEDGETISNILDSAASINK